MPTSTRGDPDDVVGAGSGADGIVPPVPGDDALGGARRVLVYGVTGSGKTTLAERISRATSLPWHPVDELTWEPGWVEVPIDEQRRRIAGICAQPEWILDSAYEQWLDLPLSRVELIVALDYRRSVRRRPGGLAHRPPSAEDGSGW